MPKQNQYFIPKENLAKVEIVQELKDEYKVPSFEEFMKTYGNDDNLSYDDLNGGSIGEVKGYGPCPDGCERRIINGQECYATYQYLKTAGGSGLGGCTCTASSRFCLNIKCYNWVGDGANRYACSTSQALDYAHNLEDNNWPSAEVISDTVLRKCATLVREAVRHYDRGNIVKGYVEAKGKFWGSYDWSRSY